MATIIKADKQVTDGTMYNCLYGLDINKSILLLSRTDELDFNQEILSLKGRDYVVVDFIENGWDFTSDETLFIGTNTDKFPFLKGVGWERLHDFISDNPPVGTFKRELLLKDRAKNIYPIEYPCFQDDYELQLRDSFNNRPITAFNYWGRSHEARLMLQGKFWEHAAKKGYSVCDNVYQFNHFMHHEKDSKKLVSFHLPFYSRVDIKELMKINAISKLSISLPGAGIKCFRSTGESIVNSVCLLPEDNLAYSYPFIDGENCIKFSNNKDVTGLKSQWDVLGKVEEAIKRDDLYDIYLEGKKLADWYRWDNYSRNYLEPIINNL
jgi:hypothetical protein